MTLRMDAGDNVQGPLTLSETSTRPDASGVANQVAEAMRDRGILLGTTGPAGNVLKIRPPLVFSHEQADLLLNALGEVLAVTRG